MAAIFIEKEGKMGWINQDFSFCCLRPVDSPLDIEGLQYLHSINSPMLNINDSCQRLGFLKIMQRSNKYIQLWRLPFGFCFIYF